MTNMGLEDLLQELAKYGRPAVHQYSASATPGRTAGGTWGCEINVPSRWSEVDQETRDRVDIPVTGWRFWGRGATPTAAATDCLDKALALAEGPLAAYARFVSSEMVKGK